MKMMVAELKTAPSANNVARSVGKNFHPTLTEVAVSLLNCLVELEPQLNQKFLRTKLTPPKGNEQ